MTSQVMIVTVMIANKEVCQYVYLFLYTNTVCVIEYCIQWIKIRTGTKALELRERDASTKLLFITGTYIILFHRYF